ncbi:hypothetical protein KVG29_05670 [Caldicoprobacter algeriensis]|uniref:hypothetical protein n=1 Tax=Caldicoprobacter algeriensis TaxID=699281 RepID=UPI002079E389|nr:hypothetical protein [Caldicoprobacter algeriensis]MCM8900716.1 hypothetical protein [Caldicoprobacter algeriensis]
MWVVVYMAQGKEMSEKIGDLLTKEGFLIKIKPIYKNVAPENNYYKIMVPKSEASEAHKVLMENKYL